MVNKEYGDMKPCYYCFKDKANRVLKLVKAGNKNLVFPDIIKIEKYLLNRWIGVKL